jgi:hypothetical protein
MSTEHTVLVIFVHNFPKQFLLSYIHVYSYLAGNIRVRLEIWVLFQSVPYCCQILKNVKYVNKFYQHSSIKFHKSPSSGSRIVTDEHINRHDKCNRCIF